MFTFHFIIGMDKRRFVLKCSGHLLNMEAFLAAYPDADLIFMHRPLREIIPSTISLIQAR